MRICILTQPLIHNYGGLLQAYALQTVLKRYGHEVWTEDRKNKRVSTKIWIKKNIRQFLAFLLNRFIPRFHKIYYPTPKQIDLICQNTRAFVKRHIVTTEPDLTMNKTALAHYSFDAYIVGSDQVWRPKYSPRLLSYFLDFTYPASVLRIAYAASFGTDEWEYTSHQTKICAALAKKFDAISVREDSGVDLCERYFGVSAIRVLDPTLLLSKNDYEALVNEDHPSGYQRGVYTYILDKSDEKSRIVNYISEFLNLTSFSVMPQTSFSIVGPKELDQCVYSPVTSWIRGFMDAKYIVTDSFHGTVFSIIFNKPFIVIANENRGKSRFLSLLRMVGLEDRLVTSLSDVSDQLILSPIDFDKVNTLIKAEQEASLLFLDNALTK